MPRKHFNGDQLSVFIQNQEFQAQSLGNGGWCVDHLILSSVLLTFSPRSLQEAVPVGGVLNLPFGTHLVWTAPEENWEKENEQQPVTISQSSKTMYTPFLLYSQGHFFSSFLDFPWLTNGIFSICGAAMHVVLCLAELDFLYLASSWPECLSLCFVSLKICFMWLLRATKIHPISHS